MAQIPNEERKTLILTGASRGIGHATVKRFFLSWLAGDQLLAKALPGGLALGSRA